MVTQSTMPRGWCLPYSSKSFLNRRRASLRNKLLPAAKVLAPLANVSRNNFVQDCRE
ncbi:unnamed protein product [Ixodes persulcatus]